MDWETWLKAAAARPSDTEDEKREKTETEIKSALSEYDGLSGRPYVVYAKGSYANNTNVRLNYDVDIAVEYRGFFYFDLMFDLAETAPADVGISTPTHDPLYA
jgi:tRNA nucleotidyltransferase (CCA-adding enzyme)